MALFIALAAISTILAFHVGRSLIRRSSMCDIIKI